MNFGHRNVNVKLLSFPYASIIFCCSYTGDRTNDTGEICFEDDVS
jgi:hypothetical protein